MTWENSTDQDRVHKKITGPPRSNWPIGHRVFNVEHSWGKKNYIDLALKLYNIGTDWDAWRSSDFQDHLQSWKFPGKGNTGKSEPKKNSHCSDHRHDKYAEVTFPHHTYGMEQSCHCPWQGTQIGKVLRRCPWLSQLVEAYVIFQCESSNRTPFWKHYHTGHIEKLIADWLFPCQLKSSLAHVPVCSFSSRTQLCALHSFWGSRGLPSSWVLNPRFPYTWCPEWRRRLSQCWGRTGGPCLGRSVLGKMPCIVLPGRSHLHQQQPFRFTSELNGFWSSQRGNTCYPLLPRGCTIVECAIRGLQKCAKFMCSGETFQQKPSCFRRAFNESHIAFVELSTKAILLSYSCCLRQAVRSCDESSPKGGRKWKWSNAVKISEMGIF